MDDPLVEVKKRMDRLKKRVYKAPAPYIPGNKYTWIFGFTPLDRAVLWGLYNTDSEAELNAVSLDSYELFHLGTVDTAKASRMVKHELIARGADPDDAMRRLIHKHTEEESIVKKKRWF